MERPSGAFRLPNEVPAGDRPLDVYDEVTSTGTHSRSSFEPARTSVRGPEYPAVRPTGPAYSPPEPAVASGYNEPTSMVPAVAPAPERPRESVYSRRRPISAVIIAAVTALLMVPVVRLLVTATFASTPAAHSIVPAVLLTLGLPLTGAGLYALAGGGRPHNVETWLRPPVVYLPAGLFLVLAGALAVA